MRSNIEKMLLTLLLTLLILIVAVALLSVKVIVKKGGRFPNTHVSGSKALRDKGITCIQSQDREMARHKNLYERMNEN